MEMCFRGTRVVFGSMQATDANKQKCGEIEGEKDFIHALAQTLCCDR